MQLKTAEHGRLAFYVSAVNPCSSFKDILPVILKRCCSCLSTLLRNVIVLSTGRYS